MRQRLLEARRKESGFTLIELLIVIVILGVLAGVVVFAVSAFNNRGQEAACKADLKAVEVAVEAYRANNSGYPTSLAALQNEGYLRQVPASQVITINGSTVTGNGSGAEYYITLWTAAGPAVGTQYPARTVGSVWGDVAGGTVSHDCSA